jgi:hypothetical protein
VVLSVATVETAAPVVRVVPVMAAPVLQDQLVAPVAPVVILREVDLSDKILEQLPTHTRQEV